jgi:hypothetical protein
MPTLPILIAVAVAAPILNGTASNVSIPDEPPERITEATLTDANDSNQNEVDVKPGVIVGNVSGVELKHPSIAEITLGSTIVYAVATLFVLKVSPPLINEIPK